MKSLIEKQAQKKIGQLVERCQRQQATIDDQAREIERLRGMVATLEARATAGGQA